MGWIDSVHCKKFRCDFMARTSALIAPVQPFLHRVSCSNKTLPNAPKHYKTHTNMSLGSNGVGRVHSLRKITKRLYGTNLCINCTCSTHLHQVSCSNEALPNAPKHYETHQNMSFGPMGWIGSVHRKNSDAISWLELVFNCTSSTHFAPSFM